MDMEQEVMSRVFSVELLRDNILGYVITDGGRTSESDIRSCRLVQKIWLESVSRCLRKARRPLFYLDFIHHTDVQGFPHGDSEMTGELPLSPAEFVSAVTGPSRLEQKVPPFQVYLSEGFLRAENLKGLQELFARCGDGLIELDVHFPKDGGSMPFFFPNLSFPLLRRFSVLFCRTAWSGFRDGSEAVFGNNNNAIYLMNSVLSGSPKLNEYHLDSSIIRDQKIPVGFDQLVFPRTISELKITAIMEPKDLEVLVKEPLPGLKTLHLLIPDTPFQNGLIYRILEHVRTTLTSFTADMDQREEPTPVAPTFFRLPLMEKLTKLKMDCMHLELEENLNSLELCLPALEQLSFDQNTNSMLSKWIKNSIYSTVTYLSISLADDHFAADEDEYEVNVAVESLPHLRTAFPNLKALYLVVCGIEQRVIQFIFREMRQLERLQLRYVIFPEGNSDFMDALLTGVPGESLAALRENPGLWNDLVGENDSPPSIRNLKELKELHLGSDNYDLDAPIISDTSFHFAFLKMAKLEKLVLWGGFMASPEMEVAWEAQGRTFTRFLEWE